MGKLDSPNPSDERFLKATEHFAKQFYWWWRGEPAQVFRKQFPGKGSDHAEFVRLIFTTEFEEGARNYETGWRLGSLKGFGKVEGPPFPKLSLEEMQATAKRFHSDELGPEISFATPAFAAESPVPPGWTKYLVATFNLRHANRTLIIRFKEFLAMERRRLGMPSSQKGRRTRPVGWRALEHYDLRTYFDAHPKAKCPVDIDGSRVAKVRKMQG